MSKFKKANPCNLGSQSPFCKVSKKKKKWENDAHFTFLIPSFWLPLRRIKQFGPDEWKLIFVSVMKCTSDMIRQQPSEDW